MREGLAQGDFVVAAYAVAIAAILALTAWSWIAMRRAEARRDRIRRNGRGR